jgi:cytochrome P450
LAGVGEIVQQGESRARVGSVVLACCLDVESGEPIIREIRDMASPADETVSIFYRRDGFGPGPDLVNSQRDRPVSQVRDFLLYRDSEYWMVTRHADVRQVLGDTAAFGIHDPDRPRVLPFELINMDPPDHTRLRRILTPAFTVKRIRELVPRIERIVADHLDTMESRGAPADIVADFALPIPSLVICELLGVPYVDRADFQRRSRLVLDMEVSMAGRLAASTQAHEYMADLVARKRRQPEDDLIGTVVREHGDDVTDDELTGTADLLLLAGHETTSNTLSLGTLLLLNHPDQAERMRTAADDDPVRDRAVDEILRFLSVVNTPLPRIARRDVELGGVQIRAGDYLACVLPIANRDTALGADVDRFDVGREPTSHVAFGHGIHHCIGAPLARMTLRVAFPALLRRFPGLRSVVSADCLPYRTHSVIYGLEALPVEW